MRTLPIIVLILTIVSLCGATRYYEQESLRNANSYQCERRDNQYLQKKNSELKVEREMLMSDIDLLKQKIAHVHKSRFSK